MNNIMLFMSYRTASKTMLNLLGNYKSILVHKNKFPGYSELETYFTKGLFKGNFLAATNPKDSCPVIFRRDSADLNHISNVMLKPDFSNVIYWARLENEIHPTFNIANLTNLIGDWKFVFVIRDGRNQIDSWMNFRGAKRSTFLLTPNLFEDMCYGWKSRALLARLLIENTNCKLIKFEDFIQNPHTEFADFMSFAGLVSDQNYINAMNSVINIEQSNGENRWERWDKNKLDTFYSIAGKEMEYFNYI